MTKIPHTLQKHLYTIQKLLIVLIVIASFFLRFSALGKIPLTEPESILALQAYDWAHGTANFSVTQPLYTGLTATLFKFVDISSFGARFLPALIGSLIVLLPFMLQWKIGKKRAFFLALLLAFDPVLIAWSKQADALMMTVGLAALAGCCFVNHRKNYAVLFGTMALFGYERSFPFLIALAVAMFLLTALDILFFNLDFRPVALIKQNISREQTYIFLGCLILFSTGFFIFPQSFYAFSSGILSVFYKTPAFNAMRIEMRPFIVANFVYLGIPFLFFILSTIKHIQQKRAAAILADLGILLTSVLLFLLRQNVTLFPWMVIAFWYVGTEALTDWLDIDWDALNPYSIFASLIPPALTFFLALRFGELIRLGDLSLPLVINWRGQQVAAPLSRLDAYLLIIAACIVIFIVLVPLFLAYFSPNTIHKGMKIGFLIVFIFIGLKSAWHASGLNLGGDHPLSRPTHGFHELSLGAPAHMTDNNLLPILHEIGVKSSGIENGARGVVTILDDPMLRWYLITQQNVTFSGVLNLGADKPAFVLTAQPDVPELLPGYKGMLSDWKAKVAWNQFSAMDWLSWLMYREPPETKQQLVIWQENQLLMGNFGQ